MPPVNSSVDKNRAQLLALLESLGDNDTLTYDELHDLRRRRGYARAETRAASKTSLAAMDAVERKRNWDMADAIDTSENSARKRDRDVGDASHPGKTLSCE